MLRFQRVLLCVATLCAAIPAVAQPDPLAVVGMAVMEPDPKRLEELLRRAILSNDPRIRAAAARVINVRGVTTLLDHVRTRLDRETDGAAAREEIRAALMLGGVRDLDRALYVSDRFEKSLDDTAALALAHLGQPAIDAYFTTLHDRNIDQASFFVAALWGRPQLAPSIATRLLAEDKDAFQMFLFAMVEEPDELLDTGVFLAALTDANAEVRTEMVWYLVNRAVTPGEPPFDPKVKTTVAAMKDPGDDPDFTVGLEMLRRILGLPRMDATDFRVALGNNRLPQLRIFIAPKKLMDHIAPTDKLLILGGMSFPERRVDSNVRPLPFVVPSLMPNGVAAAVMRANGCKAGWIGDAMVRVDKSGRVAGSSLEFVTADAGCQRALQALINLSLADNVYVGSPFQTSRMSMVQVASADPCLDEGKMGRVGVRVFGSPYLRMPRLLRTVDPDLPANPARKAKESLVELVVTRQGCVRSARVLRSIDRPTDDAVLRAVHQWQFVPANYDSNSVEAMIVLRVPVK
jgi:TonB family protein